MTSPAKTISLVVQREPQPGGAGAEIYDRRLIKAIKARTDASFVDAPFLSTPRAMAAMIPGRAPHFARWAASSTRAAIHQAAAALNPQGRVFWLHEAVAQFHDRPLAAPSTVVLHNVMSLLYGDDQGMPLNPLFRALAVREESRLARMANTDFVVISKGDEEAFRRKAPTDIQVRILPPGMPPFRHDPAISRGFTAEVVLDGSYVWWPKRRDLKVFAREVAQSALRQEAILAGPSAIEAARPLMQVLPWSETEDSGSLRIGLISDRFVGGFKLKALMFVAANCLIFTFCDIRREFAHLPGADLSVSYVRNTAELLERRRYLQSLPPEDLLQAFRAFKSACERHFDWDTAIEAALFPND